MATRGLLLVALFCFAWTAVESGEPSSITVLQKIKDDPDLSQFYELLITNPIPKFNMGHRQATVFVPTNAAFQRYKGKLDEHLVLYHMINQPKTIDQLGSTVTSDLEGNPPLWVTRRKSTNYDDIYINNGKVLLSLSNYVAVENGKKQVLHVIDEVLAPIEQSASVNTPLYNPNAFQLLTHFENVDLGPHRLRQFRQKVTNTGKQDIFNKEGQFTFFMPIDEGFFTNTRADMLDDKVIDGHVIPNHVLFTTATLHDTPFETLAFGDNLKVTVSFTTETDVSSGKISKVYIISNTLVGDSKHTPGVVQAEIVKANIPVKNGVVHLIQRPLMIVDMKIYQVFEMMKEEGPLFKFYEIMKDSEYGRQFFNQLTNLHDGTVFAPSNAAWQDDNVRNSLTDNDKMKEILNMHLVKDQRLSVEKIKQRNQNTVQTAAERRTLYFDVLTGDHEQVLTVEGGGVNATVIQADIAATDGVIHIIDKVLGVAHTTVYTKLQTDPMLNGTYFLGQRENFNDQLQDTTKKFTYFVPRNRAWRKMEVKMPSTIKKLFMPEFSYHAIQILQRHLVISDQSFTMEKMKQMAGTAPNNEIELPSARDTLKFRIEEKNKTLDDGGKQNRTTFTLIWRNEKIEVLRPDVECTNGVIHVINTPFLQEGDVRVTGSGSPPLISWTSHYLLLIVKLLLL